MKITSIFWDGACTADSNIRTEFGHNFMVPSAKSYGEDKAYAKAL